MAYTPVGMVGVLTVAGKEYKVKNPGARWVLQTQEECTGAGGRVNVIRYIEAILDECVIEPRLTLDAFAHENEVLEFLQQFNAFRRPDPPRVQPIDRAAEVGKPARIRIGNQELSVVNPGARWVLEAQDEATLPTGMLSFSTYTERILRNCVVGGTFTLDLFEHEEEVYEFLRWFRLVRRPANQDTAPSNNASVV